MPIEANCFRQCIFLSQRDAKEAAGFSKLVLHNRSRGLLHAPTCQGRRESGLNCSLESASATWGFWEQGLFCRAENQMLSISEGQRELSSFRFAVETVASLRRSDHQQWSKGNKSDRSAFAMNISAPSLPYKR